MSQMDCIKKLLRNYTDTGVSDNLARNHCGSHRLGARIYELRQKGWVIETEMVVTINKFWHPVKYAVYHLIREPKEEEND